MNSQAKTRPRPAVLERYLKQAITLAKKQPDGMLPHGRWLRNNGYSNLEQYMRIYPQKFQHIKQKKYVRPHFVSQICKRQIALACSLAKKNKGKLPSVSQLIKEKETALLSYMNRHPQFFVHIPRDKKHKKVQEHVKAAEELARQNGNVLPGGGTISKKGWDLYKFMKRNPQYFVHIPGAAKFLNNTRNNNKHNKNNLTKTTRTRMKNKKITKKN